LVRISHRYKFVFFANPKTGSSSVRQFLNPYSDVMPVQNFDCRTPENPFYPHMRPVEARECFERFGWDFYGYTKFTCVRNPWARLVSLFHHVHQRRVAPPFEEWLYLVIPYGIGGGGEDRERWRKYGAYSIEHFIKDDAGNILVDSVIRTEDLDEALLPYLRRLGLPLPVGAEIARRNESGSGRQYVDYYTLATKEHVRRLYRYDIVNYDYRFGDPA
jgi:hypothetical protein